MNARGLFVDFLGGDGATREGFFSGNYYYVSVDDLWDVSDYYFWDGNFFVIDEFAFDSGFDYFVSWIGGLDVFDGGVNFNVGFRGDNGVTVGVGAYWAFDNGAIDFFDYFNRAFFTGGFGYFSRVTFGFGRNFFNIRSADADFFARFLGGDYDGVYRSGSSGFWWGKET